MISKEVSLFLIKKTYENGGLGKMKKIILLGLFTLLLLLGLTACGNSSKLSDNQNTTTTEEKKETNSENKTYQLGETVEIMDNGKPYYNITINSVVKTDNVNPYAEVDPAEIIVIDYTYEALGDGDVYIDSYAFRVVDSGKKIAQTYPTTDVVKYPQVSAKGTISDGQVAYGLDNVSDKITISLLSSTTNEVRAIWEIAL